LFDLGQMVDPHARNPIHTERLRRFDANPSIEHGVALPDKDRHTKA
jgi:hypothetical protein